MVVDDIAKWLTKKELQVVKAWWCHPTGQGDLTIVFKALADERAKNYAASHRHCTNEDCGHRCCFRNQKDSANNIQPDYLAHARKVAAEVATWPEWKRAGFVSKKQ